MATETPSTNLGFENPPAVLYLRSLGSQPYRPDRGNVVVKLDREGSHPIMIMLPYTADEARCGADGGWASVWGTILDWSGAPGLKQEQWILLWTLCRAFHWFAQPRNAARADQWPDFMNAYLLLGEVGRHFAFTRTIKEDLLLRFLHEWIRERIPEAIVAAAPGIELPDFVRERAEQVRDAKHARRG